MIFFIFSKFYRLIFIMHSGAVPYVSINQSKKESLQVEKIIKLSTW